MTEAHQENRTATEVKEPFPVLCFPSPNPRRDSHTVFVSEKCAPFSPVKPWLKELSLVPSLYWPYSFPSRLPHIIDKDQHLRRQEISKKTTWDTFPPPGRHPAPKRPGSIALARHLSPAGRQAHGPDVTTSKSEGCANIKRLGTPGLKCIRYHAAHPEIISPPYNPAT